MTHGLIEIRAFVSPQRVICPSTQGLGNCRMNQKCKPENRASLHCSRAEGRLSVSVSVSRKTESRLLPFLAQGVQRARKPLSLTWKMGIIMPLPRLSAGLVTGPSFGVLQGRWHRMQGAVVATVAAPHPVPTDWAEEAGTCPWLDSNSFSGSGPPKTGQGLPELLCSFQKGESPPKRPCQQGLHGQGLSTLCHLLNGFTLSKELW